MTLKHQLGDILSPLRSQPSIIKIKLEKRKKKKRHWRVGGRLGRRYGLAALQPTAGGEKPGAAAPEGRQAARLVHHSRRTARARGAEGFPHCPVHGVKLPTKGVCLRGAEQKGSACCTICPRRARDKALIGAGCCSLPGPRGAAPGWRY